MWQLPKLPRNSSAAFYADDRSACRAICEASDDGCHQVKRIGKCCFGHMCIDAMRSSHGSVFRPVIENLSAKL